jgi:hypothetical protein
MPTEKSRCNDGARGGNRQTPEKVESWGSGAVCTGAMHMAVHPDAASDVVSLERREPPGPKTFSIGSETLDFVGPKHRDKLIEQLQAFTGVRMAWLRKKCPEKRESNPVMHH